MIMTTILIKCSMHTHLKVFKWILCQVFACQCLVTHEKEVDRIVEYRILVANDVVAASLYRKVAYYLLQGVIHHTAMKHFHTQKVKQAKAINDKRTPLDSSAANAQSGRCQRNKQNQRYCVIAEAVDSWCNVFLFNCLRRRHSVAVRRCCWYLLQLVV